MGYILHGHVFLMHHEPDTQWEKEKHSNTLNFILMGNPLSFTWHRLYFVISFVEDIPVSKQNIPTVYTPSSRNCIFQNITFLKDLKKMTMSPFCIPKV